MAFVQWLFRDSGLLMKTASCSALYNDMKKKGQIYKTGRPGDIIFYKFNKGTHKSDHTGIAEMVENTQTRAIEGNTSVQSNDNGGNVMRRIRKNNVIVGYGRPYKAQEINYQTTMRGDKGPWVTLMQNLLIAKGYYVGKEGADGDFGQKTLEALYAYQADHIECGTPDGICGPKTWASLAK